MAGPNYSSKHPIIQQKQTPSSSYGPHHGQDNQKMAAANDRFDSKRMTRWEPGVDFGKLVSLFGKGKKDTSPRLPPSNQHPAISTRAPPPTRNPTPGYAAANGVSPNSRGGRAGPGPGAPYERQGMRPEGASASSNSPAYVSASGSAPGRKGENTFAGRGREERLDPRAFASGARSPLSRNPSFLPDDQGQFTSYTTASRATERSQGKAILVSNEVANNSNNARIDRTHNDQARGASPARKPVGGNPTDKDAQSDRRRQQQTGRELSDPRTTDRLLVRENKDVRVPIPEIKVSEPNSSSERDMRGQDPRVKIQQRAGTTAVAPGRGIDERRQTHGVGPSLSQQGLGLTAQKEVSPLLPPHEVVPSGQRSPNRNELIAQKMPLSKKDTKTAGTAGLLDYKLDPRTNRALERHEVPQTSRGASPFTQNTQTGQQNERVQVLNFETTFSRKYSDPSFQTNATARDPYGAEHSRRHEDSRPVYDRSIPNSLRIPPQKQRQPSSERERPSERTKTTSQNARVEAARPHEPLISSAGLPAGTGEIIGQPLPTIMVSSDQPDRAVLGPRTVATRVPTRDIKDRTLASSQHPVEVPTLVVARPILEQHRPASVQTKAPETVESQRGEADTQPKHRPSLAGRFPDIKIQEATGGRLQGDVVQMKEAQVKLVNVPGAHGRTSSDPTRSDRQPNGLASSGARGQPRIDAPQDEIRPLNGLKPPSNDKRSLLSKPTLGIMDQPDAVSVGRGPQQLEAMQNLKPGKTNSKPSSFVKQDAPAQDLRRAAEQLDPLCVGRRPQQPEAPSGASERYRTFTPVRTGGQSAHGQTIPESKTQTKASDAGRAQQRRQDGVREQTAPISFGGDSRDVPSRTARDTEDHVEASGSSPAFQSDPRITEVERREVPHVLSPGYQKQRGQVAKELSRQRQPSSTNAKKAEVYGQNLSNEPAQHNVSRAVQSRSSGSRSGETEQRGTQRMLAAPQQQHAQGFELSERSTAVKPSQPKPEDTARRDGREKRNAATLEEPTRPYGSRENDIEQRNRVSDTTTPPTGGRLDVRNVDNVSKSANSQPRGDSDIRKPSTASSSEPLLFNGEQQRTSSERPQGKQVFNSSAQRAPAPQARVNATASVSPLASLERMIEQGSWKDIQTLPLDAQPDQQAPLKSRKPVDQRGYINGLRQLDQVGSENFNPPAFTPQATSDPARVRGEELPSLNRKAVLPAVPADVKGPHKSVISTIQGRAERSQHHTRREDSEPMLSKPGISDREWPGAESITVVDKSSTPVAPPYSRSAVPVPPEIAPQSLARNQSTLPMSSEVQHGPNETTLMPAMGGKVVTHKTRQEKHGSSIVDSGTIGSKAPKEVMSDAPSRIQQPLRSSTLVTAVGDSHPVTLVSGDRKGKTVQPVVADIIQPPWSQRYLQPEPEEPAQPYGVPDILQPGAVPTNATSNISARSQAKVGDPKVTRLREVFGDGQSSQKNAMALRFEEQAPVVSGTSTSTPPVASHKRGFWDLFGTPNKKDRRSEGSENVANVQATQLPPQRPAMAAPPLDWRTQEPALSGTGAQQGLEAPGQTAELTRPGKGIPDCLLAPSPTKTSPPAPFGQKSTVPAVPGVEAQHGRASSLQYNEHAKTPKQNADVPQTTNEIEKTPSSDLEPISAGSKNQALHVRSPPAHDQTPPVSTSTDDHNLDLPSYLIPMAKLDSSSSRVPKEVTVDHAAMSRGAGLPEPSDAFKPTTAQSRRKSNRMASMYGSQLSFGQDVPNLPVIPADGLLANSRSEDKRQNDELRDEDHVQTQSRSTEPQSSDMPFSSKQQLMPIQPNIPSSLRPGPPGIWSEEVNDRSGTKGKDKPTAFHTGIKAVVGRETDLAATSQPNKQADKPPLFSRESDAVPLSSGIDESLKTKNVTNGGWRAEPAGILGTPALTKVEETSLAAPRESTPVITETVSPPAPLHISPLDQDNIQPSAVPDEEKPRDRVVPYSSAAPQTLSNSGVQTFLGHILKGTENAKPNDESLFDNGNIVSFAREYTESDKDKTKNDESKGTETLPGSNSQGSRVVPFPTEAVKVGEEKAEEVVVAPRLRFEGEARPSSLWNRRNPKTPPEIDIYNLEDEEVSYLPTNSVENSQVLCEIREGQDANTSRAMTKAEQLSAPDSATASLVPLEHLGRDIVIEYLGTGESAKPDSAPSSKVHGIEATASPLKRPSSTAVGTQDKDSDGKQSEDTLSLAQRITQNATSSSPSLNTEGTSGHLPNVHDTDAIMSTPDLVSQFPVPLFHAGGPEAADTTAMSEPKDTTIHTLSPKSTDEAVPRSTSASNFPGASTQEGNAQEVHEDKDDGSRGDQRVSLSTVRDLASDSVALNIQTPSALRPQAPVTQNELLPEGVPRHDEDEDSVELPPSDCQDAMLDYNGRSVMQGNSSVPIPQSLAEDEKRRNISSTLPVDDEVCKNTISSETESPTTGVQGERAQENQSYTAGSPTKTFATDDALKHGSWITEHEARTASAEYHNLSPKERQFSHVAGESSGEDQEALDQEGLRDSAIVAQPPSPGLMSTYESLSNSLFDKHHDAVILDAHREDNLSSCQNNDTPRAGTETPISAENEPESPTSTRCMDESEDSSRSLSPPLEPLASHRRSLVTVDDDEAKSMQHPEPENLSFKDRMRNVLGNADREETGEDARTQASADLFPSCGTQSPLAAQSPRSVDERPAADSDVSDHDGTRERTSELWTRQTPSSSRNMNDDDEVLERIASDRMDWSREGSLSLSGRSFRILCAASWSACSNTGKFTVPHHRSGEVSPTLVQDDRMAMWLRQVESPDPTEYDDRPQSCAQSGDDRHISSWLQRVSSPVHDSRADSDYGNDLDSQQGISSMVNYSRTSSLAGDFISSEQQRGISSPTNDVCASERSVGTSDIDAARPAFPNNGLDEIHAPGSPQILDRKFSNSNSTQGRQSISSSDLNVAREAPQQVNDASDSVVLSPQQQKVPQRASYLSEDHHSSAQVFPEIASDEVEDPLTPAPPIQCCQPESQGAEQTIVSPMDGLIEQRDVEPSPGVPTKGSDDYLTEDQYTSDEKLSSNLEEDERIQTDREPENTESQSLYDRDLQGDIAEPESNESQLHDVDELPPDTNETMGDTMANSGESAGGLDVQTLQRSADPSSPQLESFSEDEQVVEQTWQGGSTDDGPEDICISTQSDPPLDNQPATPLVQAEPCYGSSEIGDSCEQECPGEESRSVHSGPCDDIVDDVDLLPLGNVMDEDEDGAGCAGYDTDKNDDEGSNLGMNEQDDVEGLESGDLRHGSEPQADDDQLYGQTEELEREGGDLELGDGNSVEEVTWNGPEANEIGDEGAMWRGSVMGSEAADDVDQGWSGPEPELGMRDLDLEQESEPLGFDSGFEPNGNTECGADFDAAQMSYPDDDEYAGINDDFGDSQNEDHHSFGVEDDGLDNYSPDDTGEDRQDLELEEGSPRELAYDFEPGPNAEDTADDSDAFRYGEPGSEQSELAAEDFQRDEDRGLQSLDGHAEDEEFADREQTEDEGRCTSRFGDEDEIGSGGEEEPQADDNDILDDYNHTDDDDIPDDYNHSDTGEEIQGSELAEEDLEEHASTMTDLDDNEGDDNEIQEREVDMEDLYAEDLPSVPPSPTEVQYEESTLDEVEQEDQPTGVDTTGPIRLSMIYTTSPILSPLGSLPPPSPPAANINLDAEMEDENAPAPREPLRFSCIYRQSVDWEALGSPVWGDLNAVEPEGVNEPVTAVPIMESGQDEANRGSQMHTEMQMLPALSEESRSQAASPLSTRALATPPPEEDHGKGKGLEKHFDTHDDALSAREQPTPPPELADFQGRSQRGSRLPTTFEEMDLGRRSASPPHHNEGSSRGSSVDLRILDTHRRSLSRRLSGWWSGGAAPGPSRARTPPPPIPYNSRYGEEPDSPF